MSRNVTFRNGPDILEPPRNNRGFTLVELLTVIAIIAILSSLLVFSVTSVKGSRDLATSAYILAGAVEQARSYALANNTYTWVGLFEEDGSTTSTTPATSGIGRVIVSLIASQDGTRYSDNVISTTYPAAFGTGDSSNTVSLIQISPLIKLNNVHMVAINNGTNTGNNPSRPAALSAYQIGEPVGSSPNNTTGLFALHSGATASNPTTFAYPLKMTGSSTAQYTFAKIIEFNPQGEASKIVENVFSGPGPQNEIEIALQPTHGKAIDPLYSVTNTTTAAAAIQVEGLSGQVRIYQP